MPDVPAPGWRFDNTYRSLPEGFCSLHRPEYAPNPELVLLNSALASRLGLDFSECSREELAAIFTGNTLPEGAAAIAQAYAGHQFGHFTMLGDGRAILLGEHISPNGQRLDLQYKGSGRTAFSRRGDGRASLSSMLREYVMSEAMHHLGIPSSRSLAVTTTGEPVFRETQQQGAVLMRVAASHLRVGTFEYARQFLDLPALEALLDYAVERHYPDIDPKTDNKALDFIDAVMTRQIDLVVHWMRVGFIHGVMNTDNTGIAGETFDYGPCAFMNTYDPGTVFSSIDTQGRYAYGQQPRILQWNLSCLAGALLPLIDANQDAAVEAAKTLLNAFPQRYEARWGAMMGAKIGLEHPTPEDLAHIDTLLAWMQRTESDYTNTFTWLRTRQPIEGLGDTSTDDFTEWLTWWEARIDALPGGWELARQRMQRVNPVRIPRNHLVEDALHAAAEKDDLTIIESLMAALREPYTDDVRWTALTIPPVGGDACYKTYCGT